MASMEQSTDAVAESPRSAKRIRRSGLLRRIVGALGAGYVLLIWYTTRWTYVGRDNLEAMFARPCFIGAVWHARLTPIVMLRPRHRRAVALISANSDGDIVARMIGNLGGEAVRGSSRNPRKADKSRGAAEAAGKLATALRDGAIVVITPDGPRGPRMRAKPGVAAVSALAGAPVLPVGFSARRARMFRSWDRFMLPWPFNRGVLVFGEPIEPPEDEPEAIEAHRQAIEDAINAATREADRLVGRDTPEPGELRGAGRSEDTEAAS